MELVQCCLHHLWEEEGSTVAEWIRVALLVAGQGNNQRQQQKQQKGQQEQPQQQQQKLRSRRTKGKHAERSRAKRATHTPPTFSLSESSAEVASSRSRMAGSLMIARAMAIRCFCPPDSWTPPSPTPVLYPSGKLLMKSCAFAALAAAMTAPTTRPHNDPIETKGKQ